VEITIAQIKLIFDMATEVDSWKKAKLERLDSLIKKPIAKSKKAKRSPH